eukprot:SAG31_NODE_23264_length_507_cov_3.161765_1_plen_122_part_10
MLRCCWPALPDHLGQSWEKLTFCHLGRFGRIPMVGQPQVPFEVLVLVVKLVQNSHYPIVLFSIGVCVCVCVNCNEVDLVCLFFYYTYQDTATLLSSWALIAGKAASGWQTTAGSRSYVVRC